MDLAVCVKDAQKCYGEKIVLDKFSMSVSKGVIYGLLGPSGCGKTTLLDCLVGNKYLDSGKLTVLGIRPDLNRISVSKLGYMPQEIGLATEFTIKEAIKYFGKIFGISNSTIIERFDKLAKILELPPENKLIKECSGGEQRRVSFAAALINNPQLLILDEPTVGLDPVLREILWKYLSQLANQQNTAVIITTHYIEEARRAHKVGFMREGRLLAEDAPEKLLSFYQSNTLEEVFLILSIKAKQAQKIGIGENGTHPAMKSFELSLIKSVGETANFLRKPYHKKHYCKKSLRELSLNLNRLSALLGKNYLQFSRNISGIFFIFLLPVLSMLALLVAVGGDVKNINIAIVEEGFCKNHKTVFKETHCKSQNVSCRFIQEFTTPFFHKTYFDNTDDALNELKRGNIWAVVYIPANFSAAFNERIELGHRVPEYILNMSEITAWVDISNKVIGNTVKFKLTEKVLKLQEDVASECNYLATSVDSILRLNGELYGSKNDKFTVFIIPGMLLTLVKYVEV